MSKISPLQQAGANLVGAVIHHQVLVRLFAATEDTSVMGELRVSARAMTIARSAFHDRMAMAAMTNETTTLRFFGGNIVAAEYALMNSVEVTTEMKFPLSGMFRYLIADGWGESPRTELQKLQIQSLHCSVSELQVFQTNGKNVVPNFEPAAQVWDEVLAPVDYDEALSKLLAYLSTPAHASTPVPPILTTHGF